MMCKQNVTSSEEGMKFASGLNDGIVYLLVVPYLIFAGFAIVLYFSARKREMKEFNFKLIFEMWADFSIFYQRYLTFRSSPSEF